MKTRILATILIATAITAGSLAVAYAQVRPKAPEAAQKPAATGAQIEKVIKQNGKILENQAEIIKVLGELRRDLLGLRRQSS